MDKKIVIKMNISMFFYMENLNRCNKSLEEQCIFLRFVHYCVGFFELCGFPLSAPFDF